ncbi:MAG TPA: zinc-binding alcohol dehydrogenase family protein [Spirochaetia bacterium]|nr:zinc-binding alcohol dehydrogenase family protein [Spirochaetia bacterium]
MKALQITEPKSTRLAEIAEPSPAAGEVLLSVKLIGMCGSDLSTFLGKNALAGFPRIPGHEISAVIERCGDGVPAHLAPGTDVTVLPYTNCGNCSSCLHGRPNACRSNQTLGVQRDGAMTGKIVVPWQKIIPPEGLTSGELVFVEPLTVGFHAVDRAAVGDSDTVLVFGCGMIGLGAIVRASLRGARVIATDIDDAKLETARAFGAQFTVNSRKAALHERLLELTDGNGPDVVIEAVGNPHTYRSAVEEVAFAGRIACIGYASEDAPLPTRLFVQKELDVRGSRNATVMDFRSVVRFLGRRTLPLERVVSRRVGLADAGQALSDWAAAPADYTKILVDMSL